MATVYRLQSSFDQLRRHLTQAVSDARVKPTKSAVHNVRTLSRRLEALLCKALADHAGAAGLHKEARKALKLLTKIRRLAGPARDLDVQRKLAADLSKALLTSETRKPKSLEREADDLRSDLLHRRKKAATKLQKALTKKELPLEKALQRTAAAMEHLTAAGPPPLATAQLWVERSLATIGPLKAKNLHDLRKQTKSARYVAELQSGSKPARLFARQVHALQQSIGKWHDWELLAAESAEIVGQRAVTTRALRDRAKAALDSALKHALKPRKATAPKPRLRRQRSTPR